ncbi:MAG: LamG domain-containing protein, partial [Akkermansiaceae bacterium]|nr:LamG domain-containing protein [Akkermansiaceae bacterium]
GQTDFYVDGVLVGTSDQGSSGNIYGIGNWQNGGQPFAQVIDEFAVFDRALTPGQVASLARPDTGPAAASETTILPDPVKATASSEFDQRFVVGHLYDGTATVEDIGTKAKLGQQFAGKGPGPHVVVYDMGSSVTFNRVFYAQRPHNACDQVNTIELWATDTDPGAASTTMPILEGT